MLSVYAARRRVVTDFTRQYPESWALALSAAAWVGLAVRAGVHVHAPGPAANWVHWLAMAAAMMIPLNVFGLRYVAERSLWHRRNRAMAGYLAGYLGVWTVVGAPLAAADLSGLDWSVGASLGFLIGAVWLVTPWKRWAARLCHRTIPLAPRGWRADRDCVRYGWLAGVACVANCWPLMAVCWLASHSLLAMTCAFAFGWVDRYGRPAYRRDALLLACAAAGFAVLAWVV